MTKTTKEQVLEQMADKSNVEIMQQEVMIAFYENIINEQTDEEAKNKYKIKQSQMQATLDFNKKFLAYVESL